MNKTPKQPLAEGPSGKGKATGRKVPQEGLGSPESQGGSRQGNAGHESLLPGVREIDRFRINFQVMAKSNVRRGDKGSGNGRWMKRRMKGTGRNGVPISFDPQHASRRKFEERKPGVSEKKAGAGKHN